MAFTFDNGTLPADFEPTIDNYTGLITKVARQTIEAAKASNPLAFLDKGSIDTGEIVEKAKVRFKEGTQWNEDEVNQFTATKPEFDVVYFDEYDSHQWGQKVKTERIRAIIANKGVGTEDVVNEITGGLTESEFDWDFTGMKGLLKQSEAHLTKAADVSTGQDLILAIRNAITKIKYCNNAYFGDAITGLKDSTPVARIRIVIPEYVMNKLDVVTLANIYNLEKVGLIAALYTTDSEDGHVYVFDEEAYGSITKLREMTNVRHATNLAYYFYLTKKVMRYYCPLYKSTYIDASAFVNPVEPTEQNQE